MKKAALLLSGFIFAASSFATAQETASQDMYLRGKLNGWNVDENYRFTVVDGVYTLHVDNLDDEFKISNSDWTFNYGAPSENDNVISCSAIVKGVNNGPNFKAMQLSDVTISFTPAPEGPTDISFTVGGINPGETSGTLPILYINVYDADGNITNEVIDMNLSHKNYFTGEYWLDMNGCEWMEGAQSIGSAENPLPLEIKARGNWTRKGFSKKPYKLKLGAKQSMLGLSKSKHFAILAHADDNFGYLRNFVGFSLGRRIGLPWTPSQQPVEVIINGNYRGLYFLTESIRIEKDRINITELDDNVSDPTLVSGGYLVELDNYDEDNQIRMEEKTFVDGQLEDVLRITWDTPEEYSEIQKKFVTDQFSAINNAIGINSDETWKYLDLDDAARYYIVEEIVSHTESYHGSTYLFRDAGENQKWHFSPLWDFGNAFNGATDNYFYNCDSFGNTWIPSMRENARFNEKVRETWKWFMNNGYKGILDEIDTYTSHIAKAAVADRRRWKDQPVPDGGASVCDNSDMQSRRNQVVEHLSKKTEWLKSQFGDYTLTPDAAEPQHDNTPAAPLPDYLTGVENIAIDSASDNTPAEFFTIDGRKVLTPTAGNIYIVRKGGKTEKRLFR